MIDGDIAQNIDARARRPGSYAVICFISDREGGKSHFQNGMIKELTVK